MIMCDVINISPESPVTYDVFVRLVDTHNARDLEQGTAKQAF